MQIKKYGVELDRLTNEDIELVRQWRNSDLVRPFMHYQGIVSEDMQQKWFESLHPANNLYFIIKKDGHKLGLINLKDINRNMGVAEAGIFIGDKDYLNTMIPVLSTIALMDTAFEVLKIAVLKAKISATNEKVLDFNKSIGYQREEYQSDNDFHYYKVEPPRFYATTQKLRDTLDKLNEGGFQITVTPQEMNDLLIDVEQIRLPGLRLKISG